MSIKVKGVNSTVNKLLDKNAEQDADQLTFNAIHRMGQDASNRAPVDTGLLSSTMISGIDKRSNADYALYQATEYTLVQEFEHATQSAFIRNSADTEKPKFRHDLNKRFRGRDMR